MIIFYWLIFLLFIYAYCFIICHWYLPPLFSFHFAIWCCHLFSIDTFLIAIFAISFFLRCHWYLCLIADWFIYYWYFRHYFRWCLLFIIYYYVILCHLLMPLLIIAIFAISDADIFIYFIDYWLFIYFSIIFAIDIFIYFITFIFIIFISCFHFSLPEYWLLRLYYWLCLLLYLLTLIFTSFHIYFILITFLIILYCLFSPFIDDFADAMMPLRLFDFFGFSLIIYWYDADFLILRFIDLFSRLLSFFFHIIYFRQLIFSLFIIFFILDSHAMLIYLIDYADAAMPIIDAAFAFFYFHFLSIALIDIFFDFHIFDAYADFFHYIHYSTPLYLIIFLHIAIFLPLYYFAAYSY